MGLVNLIVVDNHGDSQVACQLEDLHGKIVASNDSHVGQMVLNRPLSDGDETFTADDGVAFLMILHQHYSGSRLRASKYLKSAVKQFCPTGPGGGVDPTCGSGSGGAEYLSPKFYENLNKQPKKLQKLIESGELLRGFETAARSSPVENLLILQPHDTSSGAPRVTFLKGTSKDIIDIPRGANTHGATISHNHPDSGSLSVQDVQTFFRSDLKEVRAVGADGSTFSFKHLRSEIKGQAVEGVWHPSTSEVVSAIRKAASQVVTPAEAKLPLADQMRTGVYDRVWKTLASEPIVSETYSRKSWYAYETAQGGTTKQFCPTGPGGGVDPTCSPGGAVGLAPPNYAVRDAHLAIQQHDPDLSKRDAVDARLASFAKISPDAAKAIKEYTTARGYKKMNGALRKKNAKIQDLSQEIQALQAAAKEKLPEGTVLYRGLLQGTYTTSLATLKPGDTVKMAGFVSTSHVLNKARDFARWRNDVVLEIVAKTGVSAKSYTSHNEYEVIQAHGTSYQYLGRRTVEHRGVAVELLMLEEIEE